MATLPPKIEVTLVEPPAGPPQPPSPDWSGAIKQLRAVAQWVIGGVVATAAGVFAGGSLSNVGSMSLSGDDAGRLWLAIYGIGAGFAAIAAIMFFGLAVLAPSGHNLEELAAARWPGADRSARMMIYRMFRLNPKAELLQAIVAAPASADAQKYGPKFHAVAPFCAVRARFNRLIGCMVVCVPIAIAGFGLFAWAANPPDPPAKPARPGVEIKITA